MPPLNLSSSVAGKSDLSAANEFGGFKFGNKTFGGGLGWKEFAVIGAVVLVWLWMRRKQ